jgi:hypothetical protein
MSKSFRLEFMAAVLAACYPATGFAQTATRAPAGGAVFGGGAPTATSASGQKLNVMIDLDEAYDQNVVAQSAEGVTIPLFQANGFYTMFTPALDFSSSSNRLQVAVNASSNVRYYSDIHQTMVTNHVLGAGLMAHLTPRTSISVNQGFTYSPALFFGLFASGATPIIGAVVPGASNYALNDNRSYAYATGAGVTHQLSPRATLSFESSLRITDFTGHDASYPDMKAADAGGKLVYSLSRGVGLRLGYTYRRAEYVGSPRTNEQDFDIGIDYNRPLSKTRKTTLAFSLGPAMATAPLVVGSSDVRQQFRVIADASLKHDLGRTWALQGLYHRGLGYIEGLQTPVYSEAYAATTSGYLNRRTDLSLTAAYSTGESALIGTPSQFSTYTGDVRLRYAVTRTWAVYGEYVYYYYIFNRNIPLPAGVSPGLTRNGVRTGLVLWIPVRHR